MRPVLRRARRCLVAAGCLLAAGLLGTGVVTGCSRPGGLAAGEKVDPVSPQPHPSSLWPRWTEEGPDAPGAEVGTRQPPPRPLKDGPTVPSTGLRGVDPDDVVIADWQLRRYGFPPKNPKAPKEPGKGKGATAGEKPARPVWITRPGLPGLRPPVYADLTGDGRQELLLAADTETGRSALSVYTEIDHKVVPILFFLGRRMEVEAMGEDLLIRTEADAGAEQVVRYRWDGERMTAVRDDKRYATELPAPTDPLDPAPEALSVPDASDVPDGEEW
ncbi:hypothetical protein ACN20G_18380 [Streptomyces sp. BI20]|uniref:hypothetical protein n=1 Tax=Streptomyces sp. BI20 TaxID=3403460 RepID=UPI003C754D4B